MLTFPKDGFTDFENAVTRLGVLNARFELVLTLFESPEPDTDMICRLVYELSDEYNTANENFRTVFNSLEHIEASRSLRDFLKKNMGYNGVVIESAANE